MYLLFLHPASHSTITLADPTPNLTPALNLVLADLHESLIPHPLIPHSLILHPLVFHLEPALTGSCCLPLFSVVGKPGNHLPASPSLPRQAQAIFPPLQKKTGPFSHKFPLLPPSLHNTSPSLRNTSPSLYNTSPFTVHFTTPLPPNSPSILILPCCFASLCQP